MLNRLLGSLALALATTTAIATPLGTAFTYQGQLDQDGQPANGNYPMVFALYDAPTPGSGLVIGSNVLAVAVTNGSFTTELDFGSLAFTNQARWLEIAVSTNSGVTFTTLLPRVRVAPTPNALYASMAGTVPNGAIQSSQLATFGPPPGPNQVLGFNGSALVWQPPGGVSSVWTLNGSSAYYNGGNIGIGTASPTVPFHVNSSATGSSVLAALLEPNLGNGGFNQIYLGRTPVGNGCSTFTYSYDAANPSSSLLSLGLYNSSFTLNVRGNGNVGIGTTTPSYKLDVNGDGNFRNDLFVTRDLRIAGATSEAELGIFGVSGWAPAGLQPPTRFVVRREGTVGIGTGNPQAALDVRGNWDGGRPALQLGGQKPTIKFAADPASGNQEWLLHLGSDGPGNLQFLRRDAFIYASVLTLDASENIGVGTSHPQEKLHVAGAFLRVDGYGDEQAYLGGDGVGNDIQVGSLNPNVSTIAMYNAGNGTYMNTHVGCLTIHGGCDLAEPFPIKEEAIEKGSVVVIDDEHPGRLKRSTQAYDTRVAGIVSGANGINPGIALKQEGVLDQGENVALTGRVYVKADASLGAIKPGDLLTTSDSPGHAMKVTDPTRAQGAILGKAMSALKEGTGLVLVLVTLQ
jgi:hypothetical protein